MKTVLGLLLILAISTVTITTVYAQTADPALIDAVNGYAAETLQQS